jgi:hypothetical protein
MKPRFAAAAAVNDHAVLRQCLSASPDIASGSLPLRTYEGFRSASAAYNRALEEADAEILILVHQDVYLPRAYLDRLDARLRELDEVAPDWAVAGVVGADRAGVLHGHVWSTGVGAVIGGDGGLPAQVETLDEMILILKTSSGLRFDEGLPGFHLYAADIIEIARSAGFTTWVVDAPAVHHSRPVINLGGGYKQAWYYLRRKWRDRLPIRNLVCPITRSPWKVIEKDIRIRIKHRGRARRGSFAVEEPAAIAARLGLEG